MALSVIQRRSILSICDAELGVRKVCANGAARVDSEPHQSRDSVKCKSQKMLERQDLQECNITLKIRRPSGLRGSTPPSRHHSSKPLWTLVSNILEPYKQSGRTIPRNRLVTPL